MKYEFTPNAPTFAAIWIISLYLTFRAGKIYHDLIGGAAGLLLLFLTLFCLPFLLWWIIGRIVFWLYGKR